MLLLIHTFPSLSSIDFTHPPIVEMQNHLKFYLEGMIFLIMNLKQILLRKNVDTTIALKILDRFGKVQEFFLSDGQQ